MNHSFTAIDFETAHGKRWSICSVGLVRVENGIITQQVHELVCPPDNYYSYINIEIHGITPNKTVSALNFAGVWQKIEPFIHQQSVVAHNGAFDFNCLEQTLNYYKLPLPNFEKNCTYKIYGRDLATLCRQHKIKLNHHDALSDAMACAELYKMHLAKQS